MQRSHRTDAKENRAHKRHLKQHRNRAFTADNFRVNRWYPVANPAFVTANTTPKGSAPHRAARLIAPCKPKPCPKPRKRAHLLLQQRPRQQHHGKR